MKVDKKNKWMPIPMPPMFTFGEKFKEWELPAERLGTKHGHGKNRHKKATRDY
mgnify:FL=1|jgi:hypothetical protein